MTRALAPLLAVLIAFSVAAQTNTTPPTAFAPTPGTEGSIFAPFARGILLRHDPRELELVLKISTNEQTFHYTPNTYIFRGKEKLTADKLQPGDFLKLRFTTATNGWLLVNRIKIDTNAPMPSLRQP